MTPRYSRTVVVLSAAFVLLSACATQRYGRLTHLSDAERSSFTCRDIKLETAKAQEFLNSVTQERSDTNGAHVLGALGDLGIGNMMEGDAAIESGQKRLRDLQTLSIAKRC